MNNLSCLTIILLIFISACHDSTPSPGKNAGTTDLVMISKEDVLVTEPLTAAQQSKMTPNEVLDRLKSGNRNFVMDDLTIRNNTTRVRKAALGQFPKAVILSCLDSRVPVEDVFHSGIGNLFVARVAGNIVNDDILGSLEYACKVSGSKLVMVLGHEYCGAIKSAIDGVKIGNITSLLNKIQPAVTNARSNFGDSAISSNPQFVQAVCAANVELAMHEIRRRSSILSTMEKNKDILIVGGIYNMNTGQVIFLEPTETDLNKH